MTTGSRTVSAFDAWVLSRLLAGQPELNGELTHVSVPFRTLAAHLAGQGAETRLAAWRGFLCARPDRDAIIKTLEDVDPDAPMPEAVPPRRPATLADLRQVATEERWRWPPWIPAARISGIAAFEGVGKTRLALDLARRMWFALPWPDGALPTLPEGTRTLWICSDGQQDDLAEAAQAMGLPDDALAFNTTPDDPYGGNGVDDPDDLERLEEFIAAVRPGLVFVDSLSYATSRDLCRANEVKALMSPLRDIAMRTETSIVSLLHLSKEGEALGRRIKGLTRTLLQLDCPDPEHSARLRLWVPKSFAKKPPPLGVTMTDKGNVYDANPPQPAEPNRGGRPPEARDKAASFIREALGKENDRIATRLCEEWEQKGGKSTSF